MGQTTTPQDLRPSRRLRRSTRQSPHNTVSLMHLVGWIGPSLVLIIGVVIFPLYEVIRMSFDDISITGQTLGSAGLGNYRTLLQSDDLPRVVWNTVVWVVVSVAVTTALALPIAHLLASNFPGRRAVRTAVIVPWASSIVMSAIGFRWITNFYYGALNPTLQRLHIIGKPVDWLGDSSTVRWVMIGAVVFISLPFTVMTLLAGLQTIPEEVVEAAQVDGAGPVARFFHITLPLLRGPLTITVLLNSVWIFTSFPVVYVLNLSNPGYLNDTTTTYMYKISFLTEHDVGRGAAMTVLNAAIMSIAVGLFVRRSRTEA